MDFITNARDLERCVSFRLLFFLEYVFLWILFNDAASNVSYKYVSVCLSLSHNRPIPSIGDATALRSFEPFNLFTCSFGCVSCYSCMCGDWLFIFVSKRREKKQIVTADVGCADKWCPRAHQTWKNCENQMSSVRMHRRQPLSFALHRTAPHPFAVTRLHGLVGKWDQRRVGPQRRQSNTCMRKSNKFPIRYIHLIGFFVRLLFKWINVKCRYEWPQQSPGRQVFTSFGLNARSLVR